MKIGIFTDVHANLPALKATLTYFGDQGCDKIFHLGDLVGIGPYPYECLQVASAHPRLEFIMGNHDYWYAYGLPKNVGSWMGPEEIAHQQWTHQQLGADFRDFVKNWLFKKELKMGEFVLTFQHYALTLDQKWFKPICKNPTPALLDSLFERVQTHFLFYGHHHPASDLTGNCRYVNPGSAGCHHASVVRVVILEHHKGGIQLKKMVVPYSDNGLMEAFDERSVPARDFIRKVFIVRDQH